MLKVHTTLFQALIFIVLCSLVRQIASNPSLESTTLCKASQHSTCRNYKLTNLKIGIQSMFVSVQMKNLLVGILKASG